MEVIPCGIIREPLEVDSIGASQTTFDLFRPLLALLVRDVVAAKIERAIVVMGVTSRFVRQTTIWWT